MIPGPSPRTRVASLALASFLIALAAAGCGSGSHAGSNGSGKGSTTPPALASIAVTPSVATIAPGATQQFTATGTWSDGSTGDVTSTANWSSSSTSVATVSAAGLATAAAAGTTTLTATISGVTSTAMLTVTPAAPTLSSIAITPASASLTTGATQQFTATATYSDGSTGNVSTTAAWTSANTAVATINSSGMATAVATGSTAITASLSGVSGTATLTVTTVAPVLKSIAVTPASASFTMGTTQQFTATGTYTDGSTGDLSATATWSIANQAVATVNTAGLVSGIAAGSSTISAIFGGVSGSAPLTVTVAAASATSVLTWHFDNNRAGLNSTEASLTPANVSSQTFGKLFSYLVDGYVYGEPLLMSNVTINGSVHNVLYVATERDSVYAFDADSYGNPLWQASLLKAGESPVTGGTILPFEGVTSTPVIDPATNTLYAVSEATGSNGFVSFRLNALDIATGAQKFGGPATITASVPGTNSHSSNGVLSLPQWCLQRSALLLADNSVYIGFGNCQSGWLLAYDSHTLAQTSVFNTSPNLDGEGPYGDDGGIWMGGAGPVADSAGNIYVTTGNGPWDGKTAFGDSVLKFSPTLQLEDYFTPADYAFLNCYDVDLASGGISIIPGTPLAVAGGKLGKLYVVDTTNLGKEQSGDAGAVQTLWFESDLSVPYTFSCTDASGTHGDDASSYSIFGTSAYFNGAAYLGMSPTASGIPSGIRQFPISGNTLTWGPYTSPGVQVYTLGTTPFLSSNGTSDGVLWMIDQGQPLQNAGPNAPTSATLRAYDASDLSRQLYNSSVNSVDVPGYGIKFSSPIVANGKVYISTGHDLTTVTNPKGEIDVYGLK